MIPDRHEQPWFKEMVARNKWRLLWYYPAGSKLFSKPSAKYPFDRSKRCQPLRSGEVILVLVLNDKEFDDQVEYSLEQDLQQHREHEKSHAGYSLALPAPGFQIATGQEAQLSSKKSRTGDRKRRVVCEGCGKEKRSDKIKAHRKACKQMPNKTPPKIAKCPRCSYTDN